VCEEGKLVREKVKVGITTPWIKKENKPHHTSKERGTSLCCKGLAKNG